ncbi:hypothetical protein HMPREF0650_1908 [Hoylesella buccalis ATCC 35310]|uniref:Uncharacterized protein n=1 Tax=Hoylesella buccalis ATCC 35310 TaxID=679190 RepID=D1W7L3_9BACT|nr:hypothetical protein [Hoylesella buccalis]EFA91428.1 hypothetical protein HMPREF0650_1908 [Hoylesella buccalis ATCC 35310]
MMNLSLELSGCHITHDEPWKNKKNCLPRSGNSLSKENSLCEDRVQGEMKHGRQSASRFILPT